MSKIQEIQPVYKNGRFHLELPNLTYAELPTVSICTITYNRYNLFDLPIHNWKQFLYPQDKIEWVIVDDSKDDRLKHKIDTLNDKRVRYIHVPFRLKNIAVKRNYAVGKCVNSIIVNMDDDDVYFKDSVIAKIKALIHYKKKILFSLPIGVYNTKNKTSQILSEHDFSVNKQVPEATLAFYKSFWEDQKFKIKKGWNGEGYHLLHNRTKDSIRIPFWFNLIVLQHRRNTTSSMRDLKSDKKYANFYDFFDDNVKQILKTI